jgi:hypothetical protein
VHVVTLRRQQPETTAVECSTIAAQTVLLRAQGHVTKLAMTTNLATFERLISRLERPDWIIDISGLGNFEPGAVGVGADYFRLFKQAGGTKVVLVSGLATARLAAFTIAFAAHLPLVAAQSFSEACNILGIGTPSETRTAQRG